MNGDYGSALEYDDFATAFTGDPNVPPPPVVSTGMPGAVEQAQFQTSIYADPYAQVNGVSPGSELSPGQGIEK